MRTLTQEHISSVRQFAKKNIDHTYTQEMVEQLCDDVSKVLEDNAFLRDSLFQVEQSVEPDQRWENILAAKLARAVQENNREDYLEITNSSNNETFIITIQKKFGRTPEQLRQQADLRRLKAAKKIVNLLRDNKHMQKKLIEQDADLRLFKRIGDGIYKDETVTRQEIQKAIEYVRKLVGDFNTNFYRREMGKLTVSMKASFHEAWVRVANSSSEVKKLEKDIKELKKLLNQKGIAASKFGKYRK